MKAGNIAIVAIMVVVIVLSSIAPFNKVEVTKTKTKKKKEYFIQDPGQCEQIPVEHRPFNNNWQCVSNQGSQYAFRVSSDGYLECIRGDDASKCTKFAGSECGKFLGIVNDRKYVINTQLTAGIQTRRCTDCNRDSHCYQGMIELQRNPGISTYIPITQPVETV
jgi:hypothetical protein